MARQRGHVTALISFKKQISSETVPCLSGKLGESSNSSGMAEIYFASSHCATLKYPDISQDHTSLNWNFTKYKQATLSR